jgi:hypothetical protein
MLPVSESLFPAQFHDLEQWRAWALATEQERSNRRQASTMKDLKAFYAAMLARIEEVLPYLDQFSVDALPEDATRLFYLTLSLAEIAPAIEQFGQPGVVDGYEVKRFMVQHN